MVKIIFGHLLSPINDRQCLSIPDGMMILKQAPDTSPLTNPHTNEDPYFIWQLGERESLWSQFTKGDFGEFAKGEYEVIDWRDSLLIPSFFDMHFHWVQDEVRTMPKDSLLHWLSTYTWPYEAKFKDAKFSELKASEFFKRLARVGTLGGACYSSIHEQALNHAMKFAIGDFVIGNVLMTMNAPADLLQSPKVALKIVKKMSQQYGPRYALTPRFAPNTHPEVMKEGAQLISQHGCFIQTHLSETKEEIKYVLSIFKNYRELAPINTYTDIYHKCGLLSPKTIMGHGIHLSDEERKILASTQTAIAHCPSSNAPIEEGGLGSGLCDFRKLEQAGIKWALGSDIGGGPFLSMFDVMRSFVDQNRREGITEATFVKALYHSTLAGAEILGLSQTHGQLAPGKVANFLVLPHPALEEKEVLFPENILKKLIDQKTQSREEYDSLITFTLYQGRIVSKGISPKS